MSDIVDVYDSEDSDDEAEAKRKDYGDFDLGGHLQGYDEDDAEKEDGDFEEGVKGRDDTPSSNLLCVSMVNFEWSFFADRKGKGLTCPLHRCWASFVAGPQVMLRPRIEAITHTATAASRLLQRIRAVLLSVEKRRFMKKMTEHFERAFAMRKRQLLAIAD